MEENFEVIIFCIIVIIMKITFAGNKLLSTIEPTLKQVLRSEATRITSLFTINPTQANKEEIFGKLISIISNVNGSFSVTKGVFHSAHPAGFQGVKG